MPTLNVLDIPVEVDFERSEKGRMLNTKDNVQAVINTIHRCPIQCIKKRMEQTSHTQFIADDEEEASLVEIEDRYRLCAAH